VQSNSAYDNNTSYDIISLAPGSIVTGDFYYIVPTTTLNKATTAWTLTFNISLPPTSQCIAWGDVHYISWWQPPSRNLYNFQGLCDYVMVSLPYFSVQIRTEQCNNPNYRVSCIKAVSVQNSAISNLIFSIIYSDLYVGGNLTLINDGQMLSFSGITITRSGQKITILFPNNVYVSKENTFVTVGGPSNIIYGYQQAGGICGSMDQNVNFDAYYGAYYPNFLPSTISDFGSYYFISNSSSYNLYPFYTTETCPPYTVPGNDVQDISDFCPIGTDKYNLAKQICQFASAQSAIPFMTDGRFFDACILDICTLDDVTNHTQLRFINDTLLAFATNTTNNYTVVCEIGVKCQCNLTNCIVACYNNTFFHDTGVGNCLNSTSSYKPPNQQSGTQSGTQSNIKSRPDVVIGTVLGALGVVIICIVIFYFVYYRHKPRDEKEKKLELPMENSKDFFVETNKQNFSTISASGTASSPLVDSNISANSNSSTMNTNTTFTSTKPVN